MYALTLTVTLKFVPMSRFGAQCFGSWISKRQSVLQIPVTDEKIRLVHRVGYNYIGTEVHQTKVHRYNYTRLYCQDVPFARYVLPDQLEKNIQDSDQCWRSSKGKSLG